MKSLKKPKHSKTIYIYHFSIYTFVYYIYTLIHINIYKINIEYNLIITCIRT